MDRQDNPGRGIDSPRLAAKVREQARASLPAMLADLERWVAIDSPSGDLAGLTSVAEEMARTIGGYGADAVLTQSDAGPYLTATMSGTGHSRVVLLGHHDTVYPVGTVASRPFVVEGDIAKGPGVADMKGGIVVGAHLMRLLASRPDSFGTVELISVPDEESRGVPFEGVDAAAEADAVLCLECGRPGNGIVTERKGGRWLTINARGLSAHAGVAPEAGRSALIAASAEALRIAELDGAREGLTVNVTRLNAGESLASIAERAEMQVDIRSPRMNDLDWVVERAREFLEHDGVEISMRTTHSMPPLERGVGVGLLADAAIGIAETLGTVAVDVRTGGVSDVCWAAHAGAIALDGLGPIGGDDHSPNEWIDVPSLADRCGLVAGIVGEIESGVLGSLT